MKPMWFGPYLVRKEHMFFYTVYDTSSTPGIMVDYRRTKKGAIDVAALLNLARIKGYMEGRDEKDGKGNGTSKQQLN